MGKELAAVGRREETLQLVRQAIAQVGGAGADDREMLKMVIDVFSEGVMEEAPTCEDEREGVIGGGRELEGDLGEGGGEWEGPLRTNEVIYYPRLVSPTSNSFEGVYVVMAKRSRILARKHEP